MPPELRRLASRRAGGRCEYCRFHERHLPWLPFHVDHAIPKQHGGDDEVANLVWSCPRCNLLKGTNLTGVDPDSSQIVRLFNPRIQNWDEHFVLSKNRITGLTSTGRATVWLLQMNAGPRLALRAQLLKKGDW